ncbi:MAG: hypothetical protein CVT74_00025 [Alphaproteobacteria bacterium HGW-Alphaproteobacteria-13]|jgi:hypothetical protein|nr:MAG: hypothetical protein CVT74_00025 [Alphaproteobacteria bacterium HGW-Alphaproteobacteria-13]
MNATFVASGISAILLRTGKVRSNDGVRVMIGFSQLEDLAQLQSRFAEHADAGRRIEWLGAGAQALRLSDCAADNAARAAIAPAIELQQRATSTSGTVAAISLIFSPPFDLAEHPEGKRRDDLRAAHLSAARMALQHIEEWSAVFDEHGVLTRPRGIVCALCMADRAFVLEMLILGWAIAADGQWGLLDGWSIAAQIAAAESMYASELGRRLAAQAVRMVWLGPSTARLKPMLWPETEPRLSIESMMQDLELRRGAK